MHVFSQSELHEIEKLIKAGHLRLAVLLFGPSFLTVEQRAEIVSSGAMSEAELGSMTSPASLSFWLGADSVEGSSVSRGDWIQAAHDSAMTMGASRIVGLGDKTAAGVVQGIAGVDAMAGRDKIASAVADAVLRGKSRRKVEQVVAEVFDGWERDAKRIAVTELSAASNAGYVSALSELNPDAHVSVIVNQTACKLCLRLFGSADSPKKFKLSELPPAAVNFGVPARDKVPTVPPVHPWCQCQVVMIESPAGE